MLRHRALGARSTRWASLAFALALSSGIGLTAGCSADKGGDGGQNESMGSLPAASPVNLPPEGRRRPAPNFTLPDVSGKQVSLADHKGKVVLLNFWATWCGPCKREIPDFMEMKRDYAGRDFEIIGVSVDQDGVRKVEPFVKNTGINYPVLVDGNKISGLYGGVQSIPTTFVLDKEGRIVAQYVGLRDRKVFDDLAQALMKES